MVWGRTIRLKAVMHGQGLISKKVSCEKQKKASGSKCKQIIEPTQQCVVKSSSPSKSTSDEKSDQLQENDQKTEDMSNVTDTTGKGPSRSARRKKAKRQWLRATVNIGKRKIVCKSKLPSAISKLQLHLKQLEQEEPEYKKDEESLTKRENLSNKIKYLWKQCSGMESPAREKGRNGAQRKFHWLRCMSTKTLTMIRPNISSTTEIEIPVHDTIDFDKLQPLENLPKVSSFIHSVHIYM